MLITMLINIREIMSLQHYVFCICLFELKTFMFLLLILLFTYLLLQKKKDLLFLNKMGRCNHIHIQII